MPAANPRLNVTVDPSLMQEITLLAEQEHKSVACLSRELIIESLEKREDKLLSDLANKRDKKGAKTISHDNAWQ